LAYFGEYPLAWAAAVDDKMMYNSLIGCGADPNLQDSLGNMILHVVVARQRLV
jgi:ankyrin repeat protein